MFVFNSEKRAQTAVPLNSKDKDGRSDLVTYVNPILLVLF